MARVYVSYRSTEHAFVSDVVARLEPPHDIRIDSRIPVGVDWRSYQHEELRRADALLVFVSAGTRESDFQNAEIGAGRFASAFVDGKIVIPALIDDVELPRTLRDLDYLDLRHRDPVAAAREIAETLERRMARVRLFVSHSHRDRDLAERLVEVLTASFDVPAGELRCTSVPGYQLNLGDAAPDRLRRELGSAACVIALLTPNSLSAEWVLFELGAAWAHARTTIPLLAGNLQEKDIPGPLRGAAGGQLAAPVTIDRLLAQIDEELHWRRRDGLQARQKQYDLAAYAAAQTFASGSLDEELRAGFVRKRARIGATQGRLLDYLGGAAGARPYTPFDELLGAFGDVKDSLHYRLEQLRLLGFVTRVPLGEKNGTPVYGWTLSDAYRRELDG